MSKSSASIEKRKAKGIRTREIKAEDVSQIVAIQESIRQRRVSRRWVQMVKGYLRKPDKVGFVALKDNHVVGFIIGEIKGEGFGLEQSGWLNWVGVHPKEMGIGTGKALAERLFTFFRKKAIHDIYTAVRWDAVDMLSFFKAIGFDRAPFINLTKHFD